MKALEKLEEVASLQRWSLPHCASLPKIVRDARDRFEAAAALLGRAKWLLSSATRRDEAFSSYWNALRLLRECWRLRHLLQHEACHRRPPQHPHEGEPRVGPLLQIVLQIARIEVREAH